LSDFDFAKSLIKKYSPEVVINTIALTDVDKCEEHPEEAYNLNVVTAYNISRAVQDKKIKLVHISTDQLYDGLKSNYSEEDVTNPINVYGKTKLESEKICLQNHQDTVVVRTNFFGKSHEKHKPTFFEWVFNNLKDGKETKMFTDVFFTTIEVSLLASAIEKLFNSDFKGILNVVGNEKISKYDFGIKVAENFGFDKSLIIPTSVEGFDFKAKRPKDMSLSAENFENLFDFYFPDLNFSLNKLKNEKNFQKINTLILGGGISGLTFAYFLEKKNFKDYFVLESQSEPGGLCRSIRKDGFVFDFSVHMLHLRNPETLLFVNELIGEELKLMQRNAGILINERVVPYPFQYNLYFLDDKTKKECVEGAVNAINNFNKEIPSKNFAELVNKTLGVGIAKNFMFPYNKKCYCTSLENLTPDCQGRYLPLPSLQELIDGAESDSSTKKVSYNSQFYYPKKGGISYLVDAITKEIKNLKLNEKILRINLDEKIVFTNKGAYQFENLISTIPFKKLIEKIENLPEEIVSANKKLINTTIGLVLLGVARPKISPYQWLYLPQENIFPFRVSFPMNYSEMMTPENASSICAEFAYVKDKKISNEEAIERTVDDLVKLGILKNKEEIIFKQLVEINPGYVIFDFNREKNLIALQKFLEKNKVLSIGRFGKWEYSSMEDSILQAKEVAEKITN